MLRTFGATALAFGRCHQMKLELLERWKRWSLVVTNLRSSGELTMDTGRIATVVLRASTQNMLDDLERAVIDGVNTVKSLCNNPKLVAGAELAKLNWQLRYKN